MTQPPVTDPTNKDELLERIHRSRSALEELLRSLDEDTLTRPGPEGGWTIKDHLAHLAAWELGIAELLHGRPRFAAMQVEEAVSQGKGFDEINAVIYRLHAGHSLVRVMDEFQDAHRQLLQALDALSSEDLFRPYASFVPDGSHDRQDPVINWINGNTFGHFDEHRGYIGALLHAA